MHAHQIKDSDEFKAATGTGGVYVHQPFPTTLFREPKRDELGHIIAEKLVSRVVSTPEEMEKINRDIWRESPAAWDDDYVAHKQPATQAEEAAALDRENQALADENAELKRLLAEARATTTRPSDMRFVADVRKNASPAEVARHDQEVAESLEEHNRQLRRNLAETRAEPGSTTAASAKPSQPIGTSPVADSKAPEDVGPRTKQLIEKEHGAEAAKAESQAKADAAQKRRTGGEPAELHKKAHVGRKK